MTLVTLNQSFLRGLNVTFFISRCCITTTTDSRPATTSGRPAPREVPPPPPPLTPPPSWALSFLEACNLQGETRLSSTSRTCSRFSGISHQFEFPVFQRIIISRRRACAPVRPADAAAPPPPAHRSRQEPLPVHRLHRPR